MKPLLILATILCATACVEGTTAPGQAAIAGSFALDSVGSQRLPAFLSGSNGMSTYLVSVTLSLDSSTASYIGTERDSVVGAFPRDYATSSTLSGGYLTQADVSAQTTITLSGIGSGHVLTNGFTIEGGTGGTLYFSRR